MVGTILFLAIMAILFRWSAVDKWWLWFALIIGLLGQYGYQLSMLGFIVAVGVWKVTKDVFSRID